ncbi:hypothetical protein IKT18_02715 [Candidatus Saccharibacteria bacterium]|nr:hypothetical protein [Candidatus Saccharibacteria bacterium]
MENNNNNYEQTPVGQNTGTLLTTEPNLAAGMKPEKQVIASESDNSSRKIIILSITTGLFALLAIVLGIVLFLPKKDSPTSGIPTQTTDDDSDNGYTHNIDINTVEGNEEVTEILNILATNVEKNSSAITTNSNLEIFYIPEGFNTHINLRLSFARTIATNLEKVKATLVENGYELVGEMPHASSAPMPTTYEYVNKEKEIVCGIYAITNESTGAENVYASCAKTSWTWLTEEEKALLSALETAYYKKTNKYPEKMISLGIKIKDSEYKPYQTTYVSTDGGSSQFFRTSPYSEWQYFRTSYMAPSCEEFDTEDLKKAYLGEICYDFENEAQSTVQL